MKTRALIIFTRIPVPGETKTRLMPYLAPEQCAKLHACILKDIAAMCRKAEADIYICHTPEHKSGILRRIFGECTGYFAQEGEGLGQRMYRAIEQVLAIGYSSCVLIGTDVPQVQHRDIYRAFDILERKDIVFGPTADGGYYLVGMKKARKEVFEKQTYGHGSVLDNALRSLEDRKLSVGLGKEHHDIDTREDIEYFRDRMRSDKSLQKTETAKYLMRTRKISIIVPIYNEEKTIGRLLESLREIKERCEIILVDGGSTDKTLEYISSDFRLLHSEKGRARQMNLGAEESTGDVLFFLQ